MAPCYVVFFLDKKQKWHDVVETSNYAAAKSICTSFAACGVYSKIVCGFYEHAGVRRMA